MKLKRRVLAASLGGCLALFSAPGAAKPKLGVAQGRVIDQDGHPLGGVRVQLLREKSTVAETTSDEFGQFRLEAPTGRYGLHFTKAGFDPFDYQGYESSEFYLAPPSNYPNEICVNLVPLRRHEVDLEYCQDRKKEKFRDGGGRIILEQINVAISVVEQTGRDFGLGLAHSHRCQRPPEDLLSCLTDLHEARASELAQRGDIEGADRGFDQARALLEGEPERALATLLRRAQLYSEIEADENALRDWKTLTGQYEDFLGTTYPGLSFPVEASAIRRINEAGKAYFGLCSLQEKRGDFTAAAETCKRADFFFSEGIKINPPATALSLEDQALWIEVRNRKGAGLVRLASVYLQLHQAELAENISDQAVRHCGSYLNLSEYLVGMRFVAFLYRGIARGALGRDDFCPDLQKACQGGQSEGCSAHQKFCGGN